MHSGTGEGMHADGEYVVWQSVEELARIQIEYLKSLAGKEQIPGSGKGRNGGKTGVSPLRPMAAEAVERRKSLRFRRRAGICRASFDLSNLLRFGSRAASSKIAAFTELRWLRY